MSPDPDPDPEERVHLAHCKRLQFCRKGIREYCARNNLDYQQLVNEGLPISELRKVDDSYVAQLLKSIGRGES